MIFWESQWSSLWQGWFMTGPDTPPMTVHHLLSIRSLWLSLVNDDLVFIGIWTHAASQWVNLNGVGRCTNSTDDNGLLPELNLFCWLMFCSVLFGTESPYVVRSCWSWTCSNPSASWVWRAGIIGVSPYPSLLCVCVCVYAFYVCWQT